MRHATVPSLTLALLLAACGQSGELYLPEPQPAEPAPIEPAPEEEAEEKDAS